MLNKTSKVGLVYFTNTDITASLVDAASNALTDNGVSIYKYKIKGSDIIDGRFVNAQVFEVLTTCDAIVFASPTYMGGPAAQFKAFADASSDLWESQKWANKIAAGITCGANLNGDQSTTLQYLSILASQHGMLWAGLDTPNSPTSDLNRLGSQLGVVAQSKNGKPHSNDLKTAAYLGQRIAKLISPFS